MSRCSLFRVGVEIIDGLPHFIRSLSGLWSILLKLRERLTFTSPTELAAVRSKDVQLLRVAQHED
ncbi:hypothetical protein L227DRAFT_576095 [Lentinus tigrinus ALCF2SS1-6]|uniref:Uncharacterized protein n=1 Tax=Lentinus tigrinus ALCF2SS1-6 TaxID=1328759 RepID=A0A5C2S942_9APHY|nr:hypothetical protein L227DRAFT_576095 [Lentinus tigrinus ALCF2SS1-6]